MGVGSARKKTPSKTRFVTTPERHSATRASHFDGSPVPTKKPVTPRDITYSHHLPTGKQRQANGRHSGRKLIMWTRPRMTDKLLLHIQYECARHKLQIPWDAIAHRLHPGSSGAAIVQHLARVRRELVSGGHLVPPLAGKPNVVGNFVDPEIRGFVRQDIHGDDKETTRPVTFAEIMDDPKFDLPDTYQDQPVAANMEYAISDSGSELLETPTPSRRADPNLSKDLSYKSNPFNAHLEDNMEHDLGNMLDHVVPVEYDDVFTSPRARRGHSNYTSLTDDSHSSGSDAAQKQPPKSRLGLDEHRDFYTGMVPIFASPYAFGPPAGYIPLHLGHPMFGQSHFPLATGPESMEQWYPPAPRVPTLVSSLSAFPKQEELAIESPGATHASIDDLVVDHLPSEVCPEIQESSSSSEEGDDIKGFPDA